MLRATRTVGEVGQFESVKEMNKPRLLPCPMETGRVPVRQMNIFHNFNAIAFNAIAVAVVLAALWSAPACADEVTVGPSPRTTIEIGGASVVLVAANDQIYAFVDRLEDNAPIINSILSIDLADGPILKLARVSNGLFMAPFNHAGHMHDAFMVSLVSSDGTGDVAAEIAYGDVLPSEMPALRFDLGTIGAIALASGAIGAVMAGSAMRLASVRWRRAAETPVGSPMARS